MIIHYKIVFYPATLSSPFAHRQITLKPITDGGCKWLCYQNILRRQSHLPTEISRPFRMNFQSSVNKKHRANTEFLKKGTPKSKTTKLVNNCMEIVDIKIVRYDYSGHYKQFQF